ncbi:tryptophan--tRNA ligase, partial [Candidatus Kaiserbacteria bacterium]|nr:tryptophan--tRNA ligase [Candidatus Kaiserbacteria bacterium]
YAIHKLLKSEAELKPIYEAHKGRYGDLKKLLIEDLNAFIEPMREKRDAISEENVRAVLRDGAERARAYSNETLKRVREAIGIAL